ncbi:hypothetical protein [Pelagicoccus sp. SDUM812003]|uniref:class I SAM-dependent methyltransferase n=1 Tax=Pelagicoccus sp. SDUM812003 TaxID=3041267 RepID=UPI00280CD41A|nr:hypothetical protein [Pelagicoccus sp. SDUM812003]MDQ8203456.1 hypothetical protein [Pelagicoccus sp. SDUM812003]
MNAPDSQSSPAETRSRASTRHANEKRARTDHERPHPDGDLSLATYDLSLLESSQDKWKRSPALRIVYQHIFRELLSHRAKGRTLEIGSGCGFVKSVDPDITTSDVAPTPFSDLVVSAYDIPRSDPDWSNIVAFDVFHHLTEPMRFLRSACEGLRRGGRILLCEPAATGFGKGFYKAFHSEPCEPKSIRAPYVFEQQSGSALFANMGMGWALFERDRQKIARELRDMGLILKTVRYRDLLAYPSTGGLSGRAFLPAFLLRPLLCIEKSIPQRVLRHLALRMIITIEKI